MTLLSLSGILYINSVYALPTRRNTGNMISMNLYHSSNISGANHNEARDVTAALTNQKSWYGISLDIGTPPQSVYLQVDTGSSDLWVGSNSFSPQCSNSFVANNSDPFSIKYGDGSGASGYYAQDTISIPEMNGATINGVNFGYAENVNADPQVCGIGMLANEASRYQYSNLPVQLKEQGLISALVYSMRLGSSLGSGQLLFGGVDHSQYEGQLTTIPLVSSNSFTVKLSAIYLNQNTIVSQPLPVLLDSGTTNIILPSPVAEDMVHSIQSTPNWSSSSNYYVDCATITDNLAFEFDFSGALITVPVRSLVSKSDLQSDGSIPTIGTCRLAIQSGPDSKAILGDSFLSNVYAVYDLERQQISLANVAGINSPQVQQQPIGSNKDIDGQFMEAVELGGPIPGAIKAPNFHAKDLLTTDASAQPTATVTTTIRLSPSTATVTSNAGSSNKFGSLALSAAVLNFLLFV